MSSPRTYIPGLRFILNTAHRYMTRWQPQLSGVLSNDQYACLVSTIQAVADCLALLGEPTVAP